MSVLATNSMRFGAIIVFFGVMAVLSVMSSSRCAQLMKEKGEMERELRRLEDARTRESANWEEMTTPDRLERALWKHGLAMKTPRADQIVRMTSDGRPRAGQLSLSKMKLRGGVATAGISRPPVRGRSRR